MTTGPFGFGAKLEQTEKALEDIAGILGSYYKSLKQKGVPEELA